ncbi:MAG: flagellar hook-length control protein FliK, partial [Rhodospirillales bacterium]|nr:flagellar hook-length control protein FliK [Rhodospirillales bacterium]
ASLPTAGQVMAGPAASGSAVSTPTPPEAAAEPKRAPVETADAAVIAALPATHTAPNDLAATGGMTPTPTPLALPARIPVPVAAAAPAAAPAAQLGAAVATLVARDTGVSHLVIRLAPMELGRVEISVSRAPDELASVTLQVERPETLALLLHDQANLHRMLDAAGLPAAQTAVNIQLAPAHTVSAIGAGAASGGYDPATSQNTAGGAGDGRAAPNDRSPAQERSAPAGQAENSADTVAPAPINWRFARSSLDITA